MILVRHGQSEFNVHFAKTREDPGIEDPHLTELGRQQIAEAGTFLQESGAASALRRIVVSPYTRTLQSAEILANLLNLPMQIEEEVREHAHFACDVGSPRTALEAAWPQIDFGPLAEMWWPDKEVEETVDRRAMSFRTRMAAQSSWDEVLVVTHWGFIRSLTGHRVPNATLLRLDPTQPHPAGADLVRVPDV